MANNDPDVNLCLSTFEVIGGSRGQVEEGKVMGKVTSMTEWKRDGMRKE